MEEVQDGFFSQLEQVSCRVHLLYPGCTVNNYSVLNKDLRNTTVCVYVVMQSFELVNKVKCWFNCCNISPVPIRLVCR